MALIAVSDLFVTPFSDRKWEDRVRIVQAGKPRPKLSMTESVMQYMEKNFDGSYISVLAGQNSEDKPFIMTFRRLEFNSSLYDQVPWLTGDSKFDRFFCWPCLLFNKKIKLWNKSGVTSCAYDKHIMNEHRMSSGHIQATLDLHIFAQNFGNPAIPPIFEQHLVAQQHTKLIIKHRKILKRLIDVVYTCVSKRQPPRKGNISGQVQLQDCVKMLQMLRDYDVQNTEIIDLAITQIEKSPNILNDIVDAITEVMKMSIKKETKMSTYVSVIISDHSGEFKKSIVSIVLRYLKNGKVCERFVEFSDWSFCRTAYATFNNILQLLNQFDISDRFLAYSFDGGILITSELQELVKKLKRKHPFAFFAPWYNHEMENVLKQSLSHLKKYYHFFKTLNAIGEFFQKHQKRWNTLEHFSCENVVTSNKWFINQRKYFIGVFESILNNSRRWETEDITKAFAFQKFLKEFETVFLLNVFNRLFDVIACYSRIIKSETPELEFLHRMRNTLIGERENGFQRIWVYTIKDYEATPKGFNVESKYSECHEQFKILMNHIIFEEEVRFNDFSSLDFTNLLNPQLGIKETDSYMGKLCYVHGPYFLYNALRTELEVLKNNASEIPQTSISALLNFFVEMNLRHTFPDLYKLTELIMTLPLRKSSSEEDASNITKITDWCYTSEDISSSGDVSVLCMEFEYLQELKKIPLFHEQVMGNFLNLNKTIPLI